MLAQKFSRLIVLPRSRPAQNIQPSNSMEILQKLKDFINESRAPLPAVSDPDQPLHIDSLGLMRLMAFMESDCGIRVEDDELIADNFATLRSLGDLVEQKMRNAETSS